MKRILLCTSLLTAIVGIHPLQAETLPAPIIGIVEQATLDKSEALKSIVEQVEKKRAEIQKEMSSYESELQAEKKKLAEAQKTLSEKEFALKNQKFEERVREIQAKLEMRKLQIELGVEEAKKKVYEAFLKVLKEVKKSAGVNLMLYKEIVPIADDDFDLTRQVLEKLNQAFPRVQVNFKSEAEVKKQIQQLQSQQQPQG